MARKPSPVAGCILIGLMLAVITYGVMGLCGIVRIPFTSIIQSTSIIFPSPLLRSSVSFASASPSHRFSVSSATLTTSPALPTLRPEGA